MLGPKGRPAQKVEPEKRIMSKPPANELRRIRTLEGLKITELAGLAGVSTKTIQALEYRTRPVAPETKNKIVNGLNRRPNRGKPYDFKDLFPKDHQL